MIDLVMTVLVSSKRIFFIKEPSIFKISILKEFKCAKEENPVPKSSRATCMPKDCNLWISEIALLVFSIKIRSVISMIRKWGSNSNSSMVFMILSTKLFSKN